MRPERRRHGRTEAHQTNCGKGKPAPGTSGGGRKVRHDYEIVDTYEAGNALQGSEVKSLRDSKVQLKDAYARVERGEILLLGVHISPARPTPKAPEPTSPSGPGRLAIPPLSIFFENGRAKVELGLGHG